MTGWIPYNGSATASFPQPIKIPEGQTQTFTINFIFNLSQEELEKRVNSLTFGIIGNAIAAPENFSTAPIIGSATGIKKIGRVFNSADQMFMHIATAIEYSSDEVIVCPGTYKENLKINKEITLRSLRSRDETIIQPEDYNRSSTVIDIRKSNVTIKGLTITNCNVGISSAHGQNVTIDNCSLTNIDEYGIQLVYPKSVEVKNCDFSNISEILSAGIYVEYSTLSVIHHNTFRNCYYGVSVWGEASSTQIVSNYINSSNEGIFAMNTKNCTAKNNSISSNGTGIRVFDCKNIVLIENDLNFCEHTGIDISSSSNSVIEKNKSWKNFYGIEIYECNNLRFTGNKLFQNITGFEATNSSQIDFSSSNVSANNGTNTGISLDNSDVTLTGNNISDNNGNGILLDNNSTAYISQNNIFGNAGYAINNDNQNVNLDVSNNWWGDKNGPAQGSLQGNISVSNWLIAPVSLVSKPRKDTLYVVAGKTDSAFVYFQNLKSPDDILDITVSDDEGWIKSSKSFTEEMRDSSGISVNIIFSIPNNVKSGIVNKVLIEANSHNDINLSVRDSFSIAVYSAELNEMSIGPDSTTITPGDSLQLAVNGYDQFGNSVYVNPAWQTNIGEISSNGLFKSFELGTATIIATDLLTGKKCNATVFVSDVVPVEQEKVLVTEFNLYQNYPNPFNPVTKISYSIPQTAFVKITIYNILGQVVTVLTDMEQQPGKYEVVFNASTLSSGIYFYRMHAGDFVQTKKIILLK